MDFGLNWRITSTKIKAKREGPKASRMAREELPVDGPDADADEGGSQSILPTRPEYPRTLSPWFTICGTSAPCPRSTSASSNIARGP